MLRGIVIHGYHRGRTIVFPTANLQLIDPPEQIPLTGVFAARINKGGELFNGVANIGFRPTVDGSTLTVEVYLFNFSGDLYGKMLEVNFVARIRSEKKFRNLTCISKQIKKDIHQAIKLLGE